MKLSQMNTDQAADALIRIAQPAANIMNDQGTMDVLQTLAESDAGNVVAFVAKNLMPITTLLLNTHRDDVYEILAALGDKSVEEIRNQKFTQTVQDVRDCWDKELLDFFGSFRQ